MTSHIQEKFMREDQKKHIIFIIMDKLSLLKMEKLK